MLTKEQQKIQKDAIKNYIIENEENINFYKKWDHRKAKCKIFEDDLNKTISSFNNHHRLSNIKETIEVFMWVLFNENEDKLSGNSLITQETKEVWKLITEKILFVKEATNERILQNLQKVKNEKEQRKENRETREKDNTMKWRMINMWLEKEQHLDQIVDALLLSEWILERNIEKEKLDKIRKNANYDTLKSISLKNRNKLDNIVKRFNDKLENNTVPTINYVVDNNLWKNMIEANWKKGIVKVNNEYNKICEDNKNNVEKILWDEVFEIRSWIFDRVVEYIHMDIILEKMRYAFKNFEIKQWKKTIQHTPKLAIIKTDVIDDTVSGVDYVLVYETLNNKQELEEKACFIDATNAIGERNLRSKIEKSKESRIPHNFFIYNTLLESEKSWSNMTTKAEYVNPVIEQWNECVPFLISKSLEKIENGEDYKMFIKDFLDPGKDIYDSSKEWLLTFLKWQNKNNRWEERIDDLKKVDEKYIDGRSINIKKVA